jgi:hypothetical protein
VQGQPLLLDEGAAITDWRAWTASASGPLIPLGLIEALPDPLDEPVLDSPAWKVINGYTNARELRGPANHNFRLFDEKRIDDLLRNVPDIAEAERCIPLNNFACPATPSTAQLSGRQTARKSHDIKEESR